MFRANAMRGTIHHECVVGIRRGGRAGDERRGERAGDERREGPVGDERRGGQVGEAWLLVTRIGPSTATISAVWVLKR